MNGEIRYPRVRLIDAEGRHAGIVELMQALDMAAQASLDL
ncbi:MAG TPA: translation initiation factor IF-3, partial [Candidatus Omnitrophota bacterium]|nr:translation initiation factor IF-3 [Candidatus Omnitrophota bacterium]